MSAWNIFSITYLQNWARMTGLPVVWTPKQKLSNVMIRLSEYVVIFIVTKDRELFSENLFLTLLTFPARNLSSLSLYRQELIGLHMAWIVCIYVLRQRYNIHNLVIFHQIRFSCILVKESTDAMQSSTAGWLVMKANCCFQMIQGQ